MNGPRTGRIRTVAILGAGPAASTLGVLLARRGLRVVLFHRPKRAPLLVGESLVPAIIPMLRLLGVEEQVRHFSMLKPGATFNISASVNFSRGGRRLEFTIAHARSDFHLWLHRGCRADHLSFLIRRDAVAAAQRCVGSEHAEQ